MCSEWIDTGTGPGWSPDDAPGTHSIHVWHGPHLIAAYNAPPALASRFAAAMRARFVGLRITVNDTVTGDVRPGPSDLPDLPDLPEEPN
jgi:hypothetical protein